jgi:hypothetical protein
LKKISKFNDVDCNHEIEELKEIFDFKNNPENEFKEINDNNHKES